MESNSIVKIGELQFKIHLDEEQIHLRVKQLAEDINQHYQGKMPIVIVLMTGACFFAVDLMKRLNFIPEIHFIKASSYHEMESTGEVKVESFDHIVFGHRPVLIVEDIVETGNTINKLLSLLHRKLVMDIAIVSLLVKPSKFRFPTKIDFKGFEISDAFVVGYGLDYNNLGRNLPAIYQLIEE